MSYVARDGSGDPEADYFPRVSVGPTLPHVADQNARLSLTAEGVVASGAGTAEINTTWTQRGLNESRPYYNRANDLTDLPHALKWETSRWNFHGVDGVLYYSTEDVPTPDLVTVWTPERDIPGPPPTVTHSTGQVTGQGYQVIQDDDGLTYTFNGDGADADAGLRYNGAVWVVNGTANGKNYYNQVDGANDPASNAVVYTGVIWVRVDDLGTPADIGTDADYPWNAGFVGDALRNPIASTLNWTP